jgi:hypothetical protein
LRRKGVVGQRRAASGMKKLKEQKKAVEAKCGGMGQGVKLKKWAKRKCSGVRQRVEMWE